MKNIKLLIAAIISILLLQSCEKEKIVVEKLEGFYFSSNPKNSTTLNTINDILAVVNRGQEENAQKNNETTYTGLGVKDKNGKVEIPKIKNADYMLVYNQLQFDSVIQYANVYGQKPKSNVDFSKEFVFVLIHPSKFISGLQFYDGLDALIEDENTIQIKPSFTELPYLQNENPIYNYCENDCQVSMFKIPKSKYKTINIEWETGEKETLKIGK
jgi:hypothetical protein